MIEDETICPAILEFSAGNGEIPSAGGHPGRRGSPDDVETHFRYEAKVRTFAGKPASGDVLDASAVVAQGAASKASALD